jgi:hypothetical protein
MAVNVATCTVTLRDRWLPRRQDAERCLICFSRLGLVLNREWNALYGNRSSVRQSLNADKGEWERRIKTEFDHLTCWCMTEGSHTWRFDHAEYRPAVVHELCSLYSCFFAVCSSYTLLTAIPTPVTCNCSTVPFCTAGAIFIISFSHLTRTSYNFPKFLNSPPFSCTSPLH